MEYCSEKEIVSLFDNLNEAGVNYILLRNLDCELPSKLSVNKDIDLLVNESDELKFEKHMIKNGWEKVKHPLGHFPYLYGLKPFKFYQKNKIKLDVCFQLACRSLNKGEWFPLDMKIQLDLWLNKQFVDNKNPWNYILSVEDEVLHLVTRSVFDKNRFTEPYITRIEELLNNVNFKILSDKFELVFFKYTAYMVNALKSKDYNNIIVDYIKFKDY